MATCDDAGAATAAWCRLAVEARHNATVAPPSRTFAAVYYVCLPLATAHSVCTNALCLGVLCRLAKAKAKRALCMQAAVVAADVALSTVLLCTVLIVATASWSGNTGPDWYQRNYYLVAAYRLLFVGQYVAALGYQLLVVCSVAHKLSAVASPMRHKTMRHGRLAAASAVGSLLVATLAYVPQASTYCIQRCAGGLYLLRAGGVTPTVLYGILANEIFKVLVVLALLILAAVFVRKTFVSNATGASMHTRLQQKMLCVQTASILVSALLLLFWTASYYFKIVKFALGEVLVVVYVTSFCVNATFYIAFSKELRKEIGALMARMVRKNTVIVVLKPSVTK